MDLQKNCKNFRKINVKIQKKITIKDMNIKLHEKALKEEVFLLKQNGHI